MCWIFVLDIFIPLDVILTKAIFLLLTIITEVQSKNWF